MLDVRDESTYFAIKELKRIVANPSKPLVFWVGAGASKWLGYPLWKEFAKELRKEFAGYVAGFDDVAARRLIADGDYPAFFQVCRGIDRPRYYRFLSAAFLPKDDTVIYRRFVEELGKLAPLYILTTNIDESIEQHFPDLAVFQRSDVTGCLNCLQDGRPCIGKLHGSRSAIESAVFTTEDYRQLTADAGYVNTLRTVFTIANVIFLGYSVRDKYLLDLITANEKDMSLFGAGPHFAVSLNFAETPSVRRIQYFIERFPDNRAAMTVLDVIQQVRARKAEVATPDAAKVEEGASGKPIIENRTAYFISDFTPPGTWTSSTTAEFKNRANVDSQLTVGLGFTNDELGSRDSTAMHDLAVGLICFDSVYLPLLAIGPLVLLVGDSLWPLIESNAIGFIYLQQQVAFVSTKGALTGDVGLVTIQSPDGGPESSAELLRRQIKANPGKEAEFERIVPIIESRILTFAEGTEAELASLVRASFMMPEVSRLLGFSEAALPSQVPSWLRFPALRMAHLVHTGVICDRFGMQAAKIPFGGARLTSAAFGVQSSAEKADTFASYVLSGKFNTDIGSAVISQPSILRSISRFRETAEGQEFRKEVHGLLLSNEATQFSAAIDAGLKKNIPTSVLEKARDRLSSLLTESVLVSPVPAVWANSGQSDDSTWLWRAKSRSVLLDLAKERGISRDDDCICGSGDKFCLCCLAPLRT